MSKSYMNIICGHQTGKVVWNVHMCFNKVKVNKNIKKKERKSTHTHTHTHNEKPSAYVLIRTVQTLLVLRMRTYPLGSKAPTPHGRLSPWATRQRHSATTVNKSWSDLSKRVRRETLRSVIVGSLYNQELSGCQA